MSRVTTEPAPMTALSQMVTGSNVAFEPMVTWLPRMVGIQFNDGFSVFCKHYPRIGCARFTQNIQVG